MLFEEKLTSGALRSEIREDEEIDEENLPEELQRLKLDIVFERRKILAPGKPNSLGTNTKMN
jgi:hypothetical protein